MARAQFAKGMAQVMGSPLIEQNDVNFPPLGRHTSSAEGRPLGAEGSTKLSSNTASADMKHWNSFFGSKSEALLAFQPPAVINGRKIVSIPKNCS